MSDVYHEISLYCWALIGYDLSRAYLCVSIGFLVVQCSLASSVTPKTRHYTTWRSICMHWAVAEL